jgi:hypothetical protein
LSEHETHRLQAQPGDDLAQPPEVYASGQYPPPDPEELPPRPRRRLLTPLTGALLGLFLAALGFVVGVLVEKGQAGGGTAADAGPAGLRGAGGAGARQGAAGRAAFFGGQAGGGGTTGQVSNVRGSTLYVQDTQGNTIKVMLPAGAGVTRTTNSSVRAIHPGDSVVVQGAQRKDGSISATSIRATAASVGGSAAISQLFGGGGGSSSSSSGGGQAAGARGAGG